MASVIVPMIISMAISYLASKFLGPDDKDPPPSMKDDKPTTTATRGAFVPWLMGVRRVGPIFAWVGSRYRSTEKARGWKGGDDPNEDKKQKVYYEYGWHLLCVGPAVKLWAIYENGKNLLPWPLDSVGYPSGTTINLLPKGKFDIWWGEGNQPANSYLGQVGKMGLLSRWPFICSIVWRPKRLGLSPVWPLLDYVVEVHPDYASQVSEDGDWLVGTQSLKGYQKNIKSVVAGAAGVGYIKVKPISGKYLINSTMTIEVIGNHASNNGTYTITHTSNVNSGYKTVSTKLFVSAAIPASTGKVGYVEFYEFDHNSGANPAYVIDQLLFATYPHGLALNPDHFDIASLDALALALGAAGEKLSITYLATDGQEAEAILAAIMQDCGIAFRWNSESGLWEFKVIRAETHQPVIPADLLLPPLPEINTVFEVVRPMDKMVFEFPNWGTRFRMMTLVVDDDALAEARGQIRTKKIRIPTVVDIDTATMVAERRGQEALGVVTAWKFTAQGEARLVKPGASIFVDGFDDPMRVMSVDLAQKTGKVVIEAVTDYYSVDPSGAPTVIPGTSDETEIEIEEDDQWEPIEMPPDAGDAMGAYGGTATRPAVAFPAVRGGEGVDGHLVYASEDDVTFECIASFESVQSGGLLIDEMTATQPTMIETGPTFTALGVDIADVAQDLSSDVAGWRRGKQVVFCGSEVMFVREITAMGGDVYRLDGIIRARLGSDIEAHVADDEVYICNYKEIPVFTDLMFRPGGTVYFKLVPYGDTLIAIDELTSRSLTIRGNTIVPAPVTGLSNDRHTLAFDGTESPVFVWGYRFGREPSSGCGAQVAGEPTAPSVVEGVFLVTVTDVSDVTKRVVTVTEPTWTYTNADLLSDFGGAAPSSFKLLVEHVRGGKGSGSSTITMTKL